MIINSLRRSPPRQNNNDNFNDLSILSWRNIFSIFQISPLTQMTKLKYSFLTINFIITLSIFAVFAITYENETSFKTQKNFRNLPDQEQNDEALPMVDQYLRTEILSELIQETFNGTWKSEKLLNNFSHLNGTVQIMFRTFKRFKGNDGFFYNYDIYFLDGTNNNHSVFISNSYPFKFEDEYPLVYLTEEESEENNETKLSVVIENKLLNSYHELNQLKFLSNKVIRSNLTIQFDKENKTKLLGNVEFAEGKITFTATNNTSFFYGTMLSLSITLTVLGVYQCYVFSTLNKKFEINDNETLKYSPYLFMVNCIFNGGIGFECFLATLIDERLFNYFVIPTLLYFSCFCLLEPRIIFEVMKVHINRQFNDNYIRMLVIRKRLIYFFIWFYLILIFLTFYSYDIFFWKSTCYILTGLTFVPQIIFNIKSYQKEIISCWIISVISLNKLAFIFKFRLKENFLYFEPDRNFCIINASMIGLEILILIVLNKFGKHSFLFRKLINTNQYNYFYTIKELEKKKIELNNKICTICLGSFLKNKDGTSIIIQSGDNITNSNKNPENINLPVINNGDKEKQKNPEKNEKTQKKCKILEKFSCRIFSKKDNNNNIIMLTPCEHIFHNDCLLQWLKVKNTCPDCRAVLPNVE